MTIYTSRFPSVSPVEASIFTTVFPSNSPLASSKCAITDVVSGCSFTRGELLHLSRELAWGLRNKLGLKRGSTSMILSPNTTAYPILLFALQAAGVRATLANVACTPAELALQYSDSDSTLIFIHPPLLPGVLRMFSRLNVDSVSARRKTILVGLNLQDKGPNGFIQLEDFLGLGCLGREENFDRLSSHETALLYYSSGTTGKPKGVEITHRNLSTTMKLLEPVLNYNPRDVLICVPPYSHIYGCTCLLYCLYKGTEVIVMPSFNPTAFYKSIQNYNVTIAAVVPPILAIFAQDPAVDQYSFASLRMILSAAAPLSESLQNVVHQRLRRSNAYPYIIQAYGLTETSAAMTVLPVEYATKKPKSVGLLKPNLEVRLVDDNGHDVPVGSQGEIWVRGPNVMKGYWKNPAATQDSLAPDGFFRTGDIGSIDKEGFYHITGRKKELIKYKGYQVAPAELESILLERPDIADCAVVGVVSTTEATELPRAYIVPVRKLLSREDREEFCLSVQQWIKPRVACYKYLCGGVAVINQIPRNAAGKILRHELMDQKYAKLVEGIHGARL